MTVVTAVGDGAHGGGDEDDRDDGNEMGYFAVSATVLARAGHPAAAVIRSFVVNHDLTSFYATLLPDLPEAAAPQDSTAVIDVVRSALDDVLSAPT